jgi:hypothetical protein
MKPFLSGFQHEYETVVYREKAENLNVSKLDKEWEELTKRRRSG